MGFSGGSVLSDDEALQVMNRGERDFFLGLVNGKEVTERDDDDDPLP